MPKIFLILSFIIFAPLRAYADCYPSYSSSAIHYGIGVIAIQDTVKIYESDNEKSNLSAIISIENKKPVIKKRGVINPKEEDTFLLYKEDNKMALLSVENDTDDWYYVCYDRKNKLFGWVKKSENVDFITYQDFFNIYGRKLGVYVFKNVGENYKKLFSAPDAQSTLVDDFYFAKHIALWLIGGDWMLVKVTTYDGKTKTGWLRWRLKTGTVIAFPDFRE